MLAAAACCALAPAAAGGSTGQESLVEDEYQMLQAGPLPRELALGDAVALGADGVRALVLWRDVAPAPRALERPARFDPADPADYPAGRWDRLDDLVRSTHARGLSLLLSPSTPIPSWASDCGGPAARRRVCRPTAASTARSCARSAGATRARTRTRTRGAACCRA